MHPIGNNVLWVTLGFLLNLGYACAENTAPRHRTITHQGEVRNYYVGLPADTKALALRRRADQEGLPAIVIQPEFITADKQVSRFPSLGESDVLLAVLQAVWTEFKVHEKILLNGYSMGGQFTHRFALAHPEIVQACAPFAAGKEFAASLAAAGFTVESAWPATPHGNTNGAYDAEFEKYTAQAIDFFKRHTERQHETRNPRAHISR